MKGIELPINVLVIVAIAVIVLLGLVVLYFIGFNPFSGSVSLTSLKSQGCSNFTLNYDCGRRGANTNDISLPGNSYGVYTLQELCEDYLNVSSGDTAGCAALCGCS
jgi:hypothetical protein